MKIEPMSVEDMGKFIRMCANCQFPDCHDCREGLEIALAWIHAEARARMNKYLLKHSSTADVCYFDPDSQTCNSCDDLPHFIAAVKKEVGWVDK